MGQDKVGEANPDIIKAVGLFGGGISGTGDVCGALLGGMALISSLYSRGSVDEEEDPRMWSLGHKLDEAFAEITREYGGKDCSQIAGVDWQDRDQVRAYYSGETGTQHRCREVVGKTAKALGELLEQR